MYRAVHCIISAAVALAPAGCTSTGPKDLRDVQWVDVKGDDLNCDETAILIGPAHLYDITGDGRPEAFVSMRCVTHGVEQPEPGQLEVFAGDSEPARPARLTVLVRNREGLVLTNCVWF